MTGGPTLRARLLPAVAALFLVLFVAQASAAAFTGEVIAVLDGDTVDVLVDRRPVRVRLAQIDAPEKRQPYGTRARQALAAMTYRQQVVVIDAGRDRYGRVLGTIYVANADINAAMIRQGMAWAYRRYIVDSTLIEAEAEARAARRGLWADPEPVPPWVWRQR